MPLPLCALAGGYPNWMSGVPVLAMERVARSRLGSALRAVPPASGAVVMATGVVSVDLSLAGYEGLSRGVLALAAGIWVGLALVVVGRAVRNRRRVWRDARSPTALEGVAGTAVLGTRLAMLGGHGVALGLLVVGALAWVALLGPVLMHWRTPTVGSSFMLTVAVEALAALSADVAAAEHMPWLLWVALAAFLLGLAVYPFVLARFRLRDLRYGLGDQWVIGGALAIASLAAASIVIDARELGALSDLTGALEVVAVAVWALALLWLPLLVAGELLAPHAGYDIRRWSTVFPVSMYGASSRFVAAAAHIGALGSIAQVWSWVAFAVWLVVLIATLERVGHELRTGVFARAAW